jgi:hypothetical protein
MSSSGSGKWYTVKSDLTSIRTFINEIYPKWDALITEYNKINSEYKNHIANEVPRKYIIDGEIEKLRENIATYTTEISNQDRLITSITNDITTRETAIVTKYKYIASEYTEINKQYDILYVDDTANNKKSLYTQLFDVLSLMDLENIDYSNSKLSTIMSHYNAFNKCK